MEDIFRINDESRCEANAVINYEGTKRAIDRYHVDLPYPKTEDIVPNQMYASILRCLYAGQGSELTAVMQYFYDACMLKGEYEEAYTAFKYISVVEMEHMELLANMIMALGGDPKYTYKTQNGESCWSAKNIRYSRTPRQILLEAVMAEEKAISAYNEAVGTIKDEAVTCLLQRIIMDERLHLDIFKGLYKKMG